MQKNYFWDEKTRRPAIWVFGNKPPGTIGRASENTMRTCINCLFVLLLAIGCSKQAVQSEADNSGTTQALGTEHPVNQSADRELILEAVIKDLLTNPNTRDVVEEYGVRGAHECALAANSKVP